MKTLIALCLHTRDGGNLARWLLSALRSDSTFGIAISEAMQKLKR
jgi:hypothetical protein